MNDEIVKAKDRETEGVDAEEPYHSLQWRIESRNTFWANLKLIEVNTGPRRLTSDEYVILERKIMYSESGKKIRVCRFKYLPLQRMDNLGES